MCKMIVQSHMAFDRVIIGVGLCRASDSGGVPVRRSGPEGAAVAR